MFDNRFYQGLMEGRWPLSVDVVEQGDVYVATYVDQEGHIHSATSVSQADAHNKCTQLVQEGVRQGTIVPRQ